MTRPKTLKEFQRKGGKARARKYPKKQLVEWSKRGGRPRKLVVSEIDDGEVKFGSTDNLKENNK